MSSLPPLVSIRAFEVAARYLSFTKAAQELNVTQSAISRHIRLLEDILGQRLFVRKHRSLILTPAGVDYYSELGGLFRRLASATDKVMRKVRQDRLHIHSYTTFAMYWLIPRLARFQDANTEIDFELTVSSRPVDFEREQVHGVIRTGPGEFEKADRLFPINLLPICAPFRRDGSLQEHSADLLSSAPLLHSVAASLNWSTWMSCVNDNNLRFTPGFRFESSAMAYLAAAKGLGFALGQWEFIQESLAEGALAIAVPKIVYAARAHYFV
jgi:LysR family transcriptional regulator, glycine cleavage system transcriptional activator